MRTPDSEFSSSIDDEERAILIANRFGSAAPHYDQHAEIQLQASQLLADQIVRQTKSTTIGEALEIGCGTGMLTSAITELFPTANWLITDVSTQMLDQCRERLGQAKANDCLNNPGNRRFQVVDGQVADCEGTFDLICSNLTFQWFDSLQTSVSRLADKLNEGGNLIFNILGANSFQDWISESKDNPACPKPPIFPQSNQIKKQIEQALSFLKPRVFELQIDRAELTQSHSNFREFFRSLKMIGANTQIGNQLNQFADLRAWLKTPGEHKSIVEMNYEIITCSISRISQNEQFTKRESNTAETQR